MASYHTCALPDHLLYRDAFALIPPTMLDAYRALITAGPHADEIVLRRCGVCGAQEELSAPNALGVRRIVGPLCDPERHWPVRGLPLAVNGPAPRVGSSDDEDDYVRRRAGARPRSTLQRFAGAFGERESGE